MKYVDKEMQEKSDRIKKFRTEMIEAMSTNDIDELHLVVDDYYSKHYIEKDKLQKVVEELREKIEFDMKSPDDNRHFSLLKLHEEAIQKLNKLLK